MAKEIFFNAARSKAIEDNAIVSGLVDTNGRLILTKFNGQTVDAGSVKGPKGDDARYPLPDNLSSVPAYIRIVTLDGFNSTNGANYNFELSGLGNFGTAARSTILVHASQRGVNGHSIKAWGWDLRPGVELYLKNQGDYLFEVWLKVPAYNISASLLELSGWRTTRNLDGKTSTAPSDLVEVQISSATPVSSSTADYNSDGTITVKALDDASIKLGVLPAEYRGGPTKVKIDGVLSTVAYNWLGRYDPFGSRQVRLVRTSSGYLISGQVEDYSVPLAYNNANWGPYSEGAAGTWTGGARATKLPSGIVVLGGMLVSTSAPPDSQIIAYLPPGYRPDKAGLFPVEMGETSCVVYIHTNGEIRVYGTGWPSSWLTLDGIAFPSAGTATWTSVGDGGSSWGANFESNAGWVAEYGDPAFWKDPYGFVWYRGLARIKVATSTDNTLIFNLPSTHRSSIQEHVRGCANAGYGGVGSLPASGLVWKPGTPGNVGGYVSLCGIITKTAQAYSDNPWLFKAPRMSNNWVAYNASLTQPRYLLREDGLRVLSGMIGGGTVGASCFYFRDLEMIAEKGRLTIPAMATNARARITVMPSWIDGDQARTALIIENGSNTWFSLDNRVWVS